MVLQTTGTIRTDRMVHNDRSMTMKIMMTFVLAARLLLSLGTATAVAQSEVPSAPEAAYFSGQRLVAPTIINEGAGLSDAKAVRGGAPANPG
jgi:hypothetical protein